MDALAKIAEGFHIAEDRGLAAPLPTPVNDNLVALQNGSCDFVFEANPTTGEDIDKEISDLRVRYAPFLRSLAPNPEKSGETKEQLIELKNFTFSLNGGECENITLPHYGGPPEKSRAEYKTVFILPEFSGKRIILRIGGADYITYVLLNGNIIGYHEGFFSPFEFDITDFAKTGENILNIILLNDKPLKDGGNKIYAATGLGWDDPQSGWHHCPPGIGLYKNVTVAICENEYITNIFPRVNSLASEVWVDCDCEGYIDRSVEFLYSIYGENFQETVCEDVSFIPTTVMRAGMNDTFTETIMRAKGILDKGQPLKLINGFNRFKIPVEISNPKIWSPNSPNLYRIIVKLVVNGKVTSVKSGTFGIRDFIQDTENIPKGRFYLNGEEIKLRGANTMGYEQQDVFRGDTEQLIWDMLLAKTCNMNFLRITQRPVQEEIYDICDRLGILIQTDMPLFGVIRINKYFEVLRQTGEMERLIRSHPCCVLSTYINEPFPNANNQPHCNLDREGLQKFFAAADDAMHFENPDRVIKHIDGDYDPPDSSLPDNHCYPMWYNGHGIEAGDLHKGYWLPIKPGWCCGCGEFGSEALDFSSTMKKHYPPEWLEGEFDPKKIIACQIPDFHRHFYERPAGMDNWVKESQEYQAFATKLMTSSFRRNPLMNSFAIHLFIDAFPSGWMKAIVDCERNLKPAFFEYKRCLAPVFANLRSDRFTFFGGETVKIESYLCADKGYSVTELRYFAVMNGKILSSAAAKPIDGISQGKISLSLPNVTEKQKLTVYIGAFNGNELICFNEESFTVYPFEKLNNTDFISYKDYADNKEHYDNKALNGAIIKINNMPIGENLIANTKIAVKLNSMNPIYFASRDTGSKYVAGIDKNEFGWFYDSLEDKITPILTETFDEVGSNSLLPIIKTTNKSSAGVWEDSLALAELSHGKGSFIISQLKLDNKFQNPIVVKLLNNLG